MQNERKKLSLVILTLLALLFLICQTVRLIHNDLKLKDSKNTISAQTDSLQNVPVISQKKSLLLSNPVKNNDYLAMLNQIQYLQIEHKLLHEQVAVAKLQNELAELNAKNANNTKTQSSALANNYQLVYLGQHNQQWLAIIAKDDSYQTVQAGDILDDGSKIQSIDQDGVTLLSNQNKVSLSFNNSEKPANTSEKTSENVSSKINEVEHAQTNLIAKKVAHTNQAIDALARSQEAKPAPVRGALTLDEILLLELPPQNYTIRIAQENQVADLQKLVMKFHLDPKAMLFQFQQNQQTQHVLIFGDFNSKAEADAAMNSLAPSLMQLSPQIITMRDVQEAIKLR